MSVGYPGHDRVEPRAQGTDPATGELSVEHFQEINVQRPPDIIIRQIQDLIASGKLKPGMRLPSERDLAEKFRVGRGYIREAIKRLEFFGILETRPKKGTVVASIGVRALEGLISNMLRMDHTDFPALFETRAILEAHSAALAADRATEEDLASISAAHAEFRATVERGARALEEDHLFHLKVAAAAKNSVLSSLIGLLTPDIIAMNRDRGEESQPVRVHTVKEHDEIVDAVRRRDGAAAYRAMEAHMTEARRRRFGGVSQRE